MRRLLPVGLVALAAAGCGDPPGGDPGNKRFDGLNADGAFAQTPPGAANVRVTRGGVAPKT